MANPNNSLGTNGAFGGRTSVNAFNDNLASYSRGVLSGWACVPVSGLTVALGGIAGSRDVAVAEDNTGNKTTVNNISAAPIEVEMPDAPTANPRIDSIVAYVDNPPSGSSDIVDNYEAVGLVVVSGEVASSPVAPSDSDIRSALNSEGINGATAYYVVLANITMTAGITTITGSEIAGGAKAQLSSQNVDLATREWKTLTLTNNNNIVNSGSTCYLDYSGNEGILRIAGNTKQLTKDLYHTMFYSSIKPKNYYSTTYTIAGITILVEFQTSGSVVIYPYSNNLPANTWIRYIMPVVLNV